jgi:hypothetical protein
MSESHVKADDDVIAERRRGQLLAQLGIASDALYQALYYAQQYGLRVDQVIISASRRVAVAQQAVRELK